MPLDLNKFLQSLPEGIRPGELIRLLPVEQWRKQPEESMITAMKLHGGFDEKSYLRQNKDVRQSGMDPLSHFVKFGFHENRKIHLKQLEQFANQAISWNKKGFAPGEGLDGENLNICFLAHGGLGDFLIFCNYLYIFCQKFKDINTRIDVIFGRGYENARQFILIGELADRTFPDPRNYNYASNYDIFFILSRYPDVKYLNEEALARKSPELFQYAQACLRFKSEHERYFQENNVDGQSAAYSETIGVKRIQQPDVYGILKVPEKFQYPLAISADEQCIQKFGLKAGEYITIHRGCDTRYASNSIKLWPLDYYNKLVPLIKAAYPDLVIVQVGVSHARCGDMDGVDCNLVEQTNMAQLTAILKRSRLHIDNEGGLVHLRHALNAGPSIVLFGPTSDYFFGYSENYNLRGPGCPLWCEWVRTDWTNACARGFEEPLCLLSITPQMVMDKVDLALKDD